MSDYYSALQSRKEALENARRSVERAMRDSFLDADTATHLERAKDNIEDASKNTREEVELLDADWQLVEEHAETILDELDEAAAMLDEAGLAEFNEKDGELHATLDDEPVELRDTRKFIGNAIDDYYETRRAAEEPLDEAPGTHGGI